MSSARLNNQLISHALICAPVAANWRSIGHSPRFVPRERHFDDTPYLPTLLSPNEGQSRLGQYLYIVSIPAPLRDSAKSAHNSTLHKSGEQYSLSGYRAAPAPSESSFGWKAPGLNG